MSRLLECSLLWLSLSAGCNDTAVVLRVSGNQPQLDSMCIELDAGGAARFGRRYDLTRAPLPQTLTAVAESRDQMQALATGIERGQPRVRDRRQIFFSSGQVLQADLSLAACLPAPVGVSFNSVAATANAVDRALLLPSAAGAGGVAVAFGLNEAARYQASATALTAVGGVNAAAADAGMILDLTAADLDGDCRADLLRSQANAAPSLLPRAADGSFAISSSLAAPAGSRFASGDVDGDGNPDLVAATGGELHLYLNDGKALFRELSGAFDSAPTSASAVALGDLDGDGDLDAVIAQDGAPPRVYLGDGQGHFIYTPAALPPRNLKVTAAALGDLDGDGDQDLVLATLGNGVLIYLNRGDAFLEDRSFELLGTQATADAPGLLLSDLDGDCLPDLVVAGAAPLLLLSSGGGVLKTGPALTSGEISGASAEDVDGDGRPDLLLFGARGLELLVQK